MPGVKCRPNRGRRIREEDRDEAAGKAGGISLNPNIHCQQTRFSKDLEVGWEEEKADHLSMRQACLRMSSK